MGNRALASSRGSANVQPALTRPPLHEKGQLHCAGLCQAPMLIHSGPFGSPPPFQMSLLVSGCSVPLSEGSAGGECSEPACGYRPRPPLACLDPKLHLFRVSATGIRGWGVWFSCWHSMRWDPSRSVLGVYVRCVGNEGYPDVQTLSAGAT